MHNSERHRLKERKITQRDLAVYSTVHLKLHLDSRHKTKLWILNINMLNNPGYNEKIESELRAYIKNNDNGNVNPVILWEHSQGSSEGENYIGNCFC